MKRVPTVAVKSLLAGSVAAGVMAIAALAPWRQPAMAQGTPTITVSSTVPVEVSDPANLSAAAAFAWNEFFALTWPALPQGDNGPDGKPVFPRGQPDASLKYGDKGKTGQVVWETFRHRTEAFPGQGNPNGYDPGKPDLGFSAQPGYVYKPAPANGIPASGLIPPLNPNWNPPFPPFNNMDEVTQIGLDGMYAGTVAPSSNPSTSTNNKEKILFEAKANEVIYKYVVQPQTTPVGTPAPAGPIPYSYFQSENSNVINILLNSYRYLETGDKNAYPPPYISLPPSNPSAGTFGSIEVKASFRRLGPKDDPTKYYTANVRYYRGYVNEKTNPPTTVITGYVDSNDPTVNEVWGLTSLHIIQKTPNAPTFVFATFGHIDNILDAAGNDVEAPNGKTLPQYKNVPPFLPALTITPSANGSAQKIAVAGNGMPPVNTSSSQLYFYNLQGKISGSNGSRYTLPVNISRRLFPIPPTITAANDAAQTAIKNANPGAVWLNYRLINVQARPLDVTAIPPGEEPTFYTSNEVVETNPALAQFSGRIDSASGNATNYQGTKVVKNTYVVQPDGSINGYTMGGCMGCHGQVGQKQGGDFSVLLANGRIKSPDPIDIDESHPAVKRALFREYFSKTLSKNPLSKNPLSKNP
jgi:hypothetical protein